MKKYTINTKLVFPIDYEETEMEGKWHDDILINGVVSVNTGTAIPVYPEIDLPENAICISIETERFRFSKVSLRACRVLYLTPVDINAVKK